MAHLINALSGTTGLYNNPWQPITNHSFLLYYQLGHPSIHSSLWHPLYPSRKSNRYHFSKWWQWRVRPCLSFSHSLLCPSPELIVPPSFILATGVVAKIIPITLSRPPTSDVIVRCTSNNPLIAECDTTPIIFKSNSLPSPLNLTVTTYNEVGSATLLFSIEGDAEFSTLPPYHSLDYKWIPQGFS